MNNIQIINTDPLKENGTDHRNILVLDQTQLQLRDLPPQIALTTTTAVPVQTFIKLSNKMLIGIGQLKM